MDIYANDTIRACRSHVAYLRSQRSGTVVVGVHGPHQSGKHTLCRYLADLLQKHVTLRGIEMIKCEVHDSARRTPFVAVVVACMETAGGDVSIDTVSALSRYKLLKKFQIKYDLLRRVNYNIPVAIVNNITEHFDKQQRIAILFETMYSRRCTTQMERIASDLDTLCNLDHIQDDSVTQQFIRCRPHVERGFQRYIRSLNKCESFDCEDLAKAIC